MPLVARTHSSDLGVVIVLAQRAKFLFSTSLSLCYFGSFFIPLNNVRSQHCYMAMVDVLHELCREQERHSDFTAVRSRENLNVLLLQ